MGLMTGVLNLLFGGGRNAVAETAEVFRENAEQAGVRGAAVQTEVLRQFAAEFARPRQGLFDRAIDAINRLPRPMLALGTLSLFGVAMYDPIWFSSRMQGLALVPEPLWWLMGAVVSFYFGARHQAKGQDFQRSIAETFARTADVTRNIKSLEALDDPETHAADSADLVFDPDAVASEEPTDPDEAARAKASEPVIAAAAKNPALADWQAQNGS